MWMDLQNSFTLTPLAFLRALMLSANFFVEKFLSFIFFQFVLNLGHNPLYGHFCKCLYIEMLKISLVY